MANLLCILSQLHAFSVENQANLSPNDFCSSDSTEIHKLTTMTPPGGFANPVISVTACLQRNGHELLHRKSHLLVSVLLF